jgi:hypothetical protein
MANTLLFMIAGVSEAEGIFMAHSAFATLLAINIALAIFLLSFGQTTEHSELRRLSSSSCCFSGW